MTNKKWIGHILSAEWEQQRIIYLFVNSGIVPYHLFICEFRDCLIGLGLVLKWVYKAF